MASVPAQDGEPYLSALSHVSPMAQSLQPLNATGGTLTGDLYCLNRIIRLGLTREEHRGGGELSA